MSPLPKTAAESIIAVFEKIREGGSLKTLDLPGWTNDSDNTAFLEITNTVSVQTIDYEGQNDLEVWIDDWIFGNVTNAKMINCHERGALALVVDDGTTLIYMIEQDDSSEVPE